MIPENHLKNARWVVDPGLEAREAALQDDPENSGLRTIVEGHQRAANVMVRRVIAALNGFDVVNHVSPWMDAPAIMSRELAQKLKRALLNPEVAPVLEQLLGSDAASVLLGEIDSL